MAGKVLWSGLTLIVAFPALPVIGALAPWVLFGALVMTLGVVLLWMDK